MSNPNNSTSWPWMHGAECAIANPIPPVDRSDERPAVKDLIAEHRTLIDRVRRELAATALFQPSKHDDLWALRFVLTHKKKNVKAAVKAAKAALAFRHENGLDERDIRAYSPHDIRAQKFSEPLQRYFRGGVGQDGFRFIVPDPKRGVIALMKASSIDQNMLVKNVDEDDWTPAIGYMSEWTFQWVDYVTRTTGRFTKTIRLVDASDIDLSCLNRETQKRNANAAKFLMNHYPQMLHKFYIFNAPSWINVPYKLARVLLPKTMTEKIDFVEPSRRDKECQRLLRHIAAEHLPTRFGGKNRQWPVDFPPPLDCQVA